MASTAELPGLIIAALVMDVFGRKWCASHLLHISHTHIIGPRQCCKPRSLDIVVIGHSPTSLADKACYFMEWSRIDLA